MTEVSQERQDHHRTLKRIMALGIDQVTVTVGILRKKVPPLISEWTEMQDSEGGQKETVVSASFFIILTEN